MNPLSKLALRVLRPVRNRDGATTVFFGLMVVMLLATFSLAVDVGLWLNTGSEAQRAADSAALAGAGEFMNGTRTAMQSQPIAEATARQFAGLNSIGLALIDSNDPQAVEIVTFPIAERKIGVRIRGDSPSIFARFLGFDDLDVERYAEARVITGDGATCVKPFALPDMWDEGGLTPGSNGDDTNGDDVWQPPVGNGRNATGENWEFNPDQDRYAKWTGVESNDATTGYGSSLRNGADATVQGDVGRLVTIKAAAPPQGCQNCDPSTSQIYPGQFFALQMPQDPNMAGTCGIGGAQNQGQAAYSNNICECNMSVMDFETDYELLNGNAVGPTNFGIEALIGDDQTSWEDALAGAETPRVIKVALYDPALVQASGGATIRINNIAKFYVQENGQGEITGRFMKYAEGVGQGTGTMTRALQLVK